MLLSHACVCGSRPCSPDWVPVSHCFSPEVPTFLPIEGLLHDYDVSVHPSHPLQEGSFPSAPPDEPSGHTTLFPTPRHDARLHRFQFRHVTGGKEDRECFFPGLSVKLRHDARVRAGPELHATVRNRLLDILDRVRSTGVGQGSFNERTIGSIHRLSGQWPNGHAIDPHEEPGRGRPYVTVHGRALRAD